MNQEEIKQMIVRLRHIYADGDPITEEAADMLESLSNQLAGCRRDIADLNEVRQNDIDEFNRVNTELAALKAEMNKLSEQEPLGWQGHSGHLVYDKKSLLPSTRRLAKPIYLHPAPSVPEGYQLVPKLSDYKMNDAGVGAFKSRSTVSKFCGFDWRDSEAIYIAMLSAAKG